MLKHINSSNVTSNSKADIESERNFLLNINKFKENLIKYFENENGNNDNYKNIILITNQANEWQIKNTNVIKCNNNIIKNKIINNKKNTSNNSSLSLIQHDLEMQFSEALEKETNLRNEIINNIIIFEENNNNKYNLINIVENFIKKEKNLKKSKKSKKPKKTKKKKKKEKQ